jgi:hypothetical protein
MGHALMDKPENLKLCCIRLHNNTVVMEMAANMTIICVILVVQLVNVLTARNAVMTLGSTH